MFDLDRHSGKYVYNVIKDFFVDLKIWDKVVDSCTDGEPAMSATNI